MNHNSYWYLGLSFFSLLLLSYIFYKTRRIHVLFQFLIVVEVAYLIEAVIYIFLGSYLYHPKLIKHNPYYDSHLGALTSNLITVPVLATFISAFQLNWLWIIGCTAFLAMVEWLFVKLQIYTLHWWRIEYTSLGLLLYFPFSKLIYKRIMRPLKGFFHTIFLFLCIAPISGTLHFLPFMFFSNRIYRPGWFNDPSYDTSAFAIVYYLCASLYVVVMAQLNWNPKWKKYVFTLLVVTALTIVLKKAGLLISLVWWDTSLYTLFPLVILLAAEKIHKRLYSSY